MHLSVRLNGYNHVIYFDLGFFIFLYDFFLKIL